MLQTHPNLLNKEICKTIDFLMVSIIKVAFMHNSLIMSIMNIMNNYVIACKKAKIAFLVDSTNLHHFDVLQKQVYNMYRLFEAGTSVSIVTYGGSTDESLISFRSYQDLTVLQMACQSMGYQGTKGRKTGAALTKMASVFGGASGGVKQLLFLLITGKSDDDVVGPARNLVQKGVSIFAVGIGGSVDSNELKTISRYYLTTKWRGLVTSLVKIQNTVIKGSI